MKTAIKLCIPLSGETDVFSLDGDCVCCGKPADGVFQYRHDYKLEYWVKRHRVLAKETWKDQNGNPKTGRIEFTLPYCARHLVQSERLRYHRDTQTSLVAWFMPASVLGYFVWLGLDLPVFSIINKAHVFAKFIFIPVAILFSALILGSLFLLTLNVILSNFEAYADHPLDSNAVGGSGLALDIRPTPYSKKQGSLEYELQLGFMRKEAAEQFMAKYPAASVIRFT